MADLLGFDAPDGLTDAEPSDNALPFDGERVH
jgi:hypothetical protein